MLSKRLGSRVNQAEEMKIDDDNITKRKKGIDGKVIIEK